MVIKTLSRLLVAVLMCAAAPAVAAPALQLDVGLARPVLLAGRKNVAHLRVSLIGRQVAAGGPRPQANVCLAIDRSGSMQGRKMVEARRGAISALQRLRASDIVSVVAYDDVVEVVVPATRASDRPVLEAGIMALEPRGSTALYAGVVKCAAEVRKFKSNDRVNRIILLSDGIANVGPSSPSELGALGARLMELEIFPAELRARRGQQTVELSLREVGILQLLHENTGRVVDRDTFFNRLWGLDHVPNSRTLDQQISKLRRRIELDPTQPRLIRTVHGMGYRFEG
jgi:Ca-activated chloride channel family protein